MVFESWREHTVESHASRFRKKLALEQRGIVHVLLDSTWLPPNMERSVLLTLADQCHTKSNGAVPAS